MLTHKLMQLVVVGGSEWVMIVLLLLSVASVAVIVERWAFFRKYQKRIDMIDARVIPLLAKNDWTTLKLQLFEANYLPLIEALSCDDAPKCQAATQRVSSALSRERLRLEHRLNFLGTLGNNAPFIGLFGTVLGIIRAFRDLSLETKLTNSSAVMAGISEALVATAIGLFVAIPAVLFYNYFEKQVDRVLSITESLSQSIIAASTMRHEGHPRT